MPKFTAPVFIPVGFVEGIKVSYTEVAKATGAQLSLAIVHEPDGEFKRDLMELARRFRAASGSPEDTIGKVLMGRDA